MTHIYKSPEGERLVRQCYLALLQHWPVPNQQLRIATTQGETFVIASGAEDAPPLLLLHGSAANSAMWMGEIRTLCRYFRVYTIDVIGEAGLSAPSRPPLASDANAVWLDEVFRGLGIERASLCGVSLGGWLALDYAIRRAQRVERLAVLCPGGIGRQKLGIVFATILLRRCGAWGRRRLKEMILRRPPADPSPAIKAFLNFLSLIHEHFRPRMVKLPVFADDALRRLDIPVLAIVGGRDMLLDSAETKRRLERHVPKAKVVYLPEAGHFIPNQAAEVLPFLRHGDTALLSEDVHEEPGSEVRANQ
jgi:pimeloyl-ACP methyl ester carboxylesterase